MKLYEAAKLIRSKNAGPFILTIDVLFENTENYYRVIKSKKLNVRNISAIYRLPESQISIFECPNSLAIKISFPRTIASGDIGDNDLFGGQQHSPLVFLEI